MTWKACPAFFAPVPFIPPYPVVSSVVSSLAWTLGPGLNRTIHQPGEVFLPSLLHREVKGAAAKEE